MSNWPLLVALLLLTVWIVVSRMGKLPPDEAKKLIASGARLVDVRSPGEFRAGHLAGARNFPVGEIDRRAGEIGPKDAPVIVYCASGMRSASAARTLKSLGFSRVYDLGAMSRF